VGDRSTVRKSWWSFAAVLGGLTVFFAVVAQLYFRRYKLPIHAEVALYLCLMSLVILAVMPALAATRAVIERWLPRSVLPALLIGSTVASYLIYALPCHDFRLSNLLRLLAICGLPPLAYVVAPVRDPSRLSWQAAVVWTGLVFVMLFRLWNGIWNVPVNLDFMARLLFIAVAAWCWVFVRPIPGLGYSISLSSRTLRVASLNFVYFAALAVPASIAWRFAGWDNRWRGIQDFCISYVEIFIFIAWLEELLFRGLLQSLLSSTVKSERLGQFAASIAFGFSHILLAPAPNLRYVILASVAGWFYGAAFRQGGNLMAPSLAHALVDTAWRTWFGGRG
jgi:membrane protease YdiL (CAAX protease family)